MDTIIFKKTEEQIKKLIEKINKIDSIGDEECIKKLEEFKNELTDLGKKIKLDIAFVGQYSAGKSTIISAITGNIDIKIGQDITTDKTKEYPWGNILLVDTPGIYAGRPEHDKISLEYMNKADLLVYVITTQGFSSETAKNFRKLAFEESRIDKMMLVINKSSQGDKEIAMNSWISDALMVTEPKTSNDLYLTVIDAKDYIDSIELEEEERNELIKYSGFDNFIENLNKFIKEKGFLGRLITPLNLIETSLNKFINLLTAGNEDTKNLLELLNRKHFRLIKSEKNVTDAVNGFIDKLSSNIKNESNKIANLIEKDGDIEILNSEYKNSIEEIKRLSDDTNRNIESYIETEFSQLQSELDILMKSEVAQTLISKQNIKASFNTDIDLSGIDTKRINSGIDILNNISKFAEGFATNKESVKLGLEGLKKVSGSDAHKFIYKVGKFFGHKFKPYEAVKYSDKIAKVGSILGKVAIVLPFLVAGYEEYSEIKYSKKIKEERQIVRQSFDDVVNEINSIYHEQFEKLVLESYRSELTNIEKISKSIRDKKKLKDENVLYLEELLSNCKSILEQINSIS